MVLVLVVVVVVVAMVVTVFSADVDALWKGLGQRPFPLPAVGLGPECCDRRVEPPAKPW